MKFMLGMLSGLDYIWALLRYIFIKLYLIQPSQLSLFHSPVSVELCVFFNNVFPAMKDNEHMCWA